MWKFLSDLFKPRPTPVIPVATPPVVIKKEVIYGSRYLKKGMQGLDVEELQIRLAGFSGGIPDGNFGPGTEKQVNQFQKDFMKRNPTGLVDRDTFIALDQLADKYPIDFKKLACPCGICKGFGSGLYMGHYREGMPKTEEFYMYEYPGIHRVILWAARALFFYHADLTFLFTAGYRCSVNNQQKGRTSTNHCGKALDMDVPLNTGEDKKDDMNRCNMLRDSLVTMANAQIGWPAMNKKSLEPSDIAPTWVHYDVRQFEKKYLENRFFCRNLADLDNTLPITI